MSDKKIVNVASFNRIDSLLRTVDSIYDQCDELNIFLNDFNGELPSKFLDDKINIYFSDNRYGDALKFAKLEESEGYYLTIDDDLIYPKNYVEYMVARCKEYSNQRVITLHGKNFSSFPIQSYYKSHSEYYHCLLPMRKNVMVQFAGTGVLCFHTSLMKIPLDFFKLPNMADIWVGKYCKENDIKIICITHPKDFLRYQEQKETIYDTFSKNDKIQTLVTNSIYNKNIKFNSNEIEMMDHEVIPIKTEEKPISIKSTIEKSVKTINYEKVNQIFNNTPSHKAVKPKNITGNPTLKTNASLINKLVLTKRKR